MTNGPTWLIDAHVHLHESFSLADAFAAADRQFQRSAQGLALEDGWAGCIMLAENEGEARFRGFQRRGLGPGAGDWNVQPTAEEISLLVCRGDRPRFVLVAGRQLVTADRLEVLTPGTAEPLANGATLEEAIDWAAEADALAIIPWGFGKWWARRGARLARLVAEPAGRRFFLGDNGGRPHRVPPPPILGRAARGGIWNLPGSDPLPLPGESDRIGSYGFLVPSVPDVERPFAQIRAAIRRFEAQPDLYGRRGGLWRFVEIQTRLRLRGRTPAPLS